MSGEDPIRGYESDMNRDLVEYEDLPESTKSRIRPLGRRAQREMSGMFFGTQPTRKDSIEGPLDDPDERWREIWVVGHLHSEVYGEASIRSEIKIDREFKLKQMTLRFPVVRITEYPGTVADIEQELWEMSASLLENPNVRSMYPQVGGSMEGNGYGYLFQLWLPEPSRDYSPESVIDIGESEQEPPRIEDAGEYALSELGDLLDEIAPTIQRSASTASRRDRPTVEETTDLFDAVMDEWKRRFEQPAERR